MVWIDMKSTPLNNRRFQFVAKNYLIIVADERVFHISSSHHSTSLHRFHKRKCCRISLNQWASSPEEITCWCCLHAQIQINWHSKHFCLRFRHDGFGVYWWREFNFCACSFPSFQYAWRFGAETFLAPKINSFRQKFAFSTRLYWRLCQNCFSQNENYEKFQHFNALRTANENSLSDLIRNQNLVVGDINFVFPIRLQPGNLLLLLITKLTHPFNETRSGHYRLLSYQTSRGVMKSSNLWNLIRNFVNLVTGRLSPNDDNKKERIFVKLHSLFGWTN